MNQIQPGGHTEERISAAIGQVQNIAAPVPRIERCEFETLLERAMEILTARAKSASASHA